MIRCGERHSLFLGAEGVVWACGSNTAGQLGIGITGYIGTPRRISIPQIKKVSCGLYFTVCVSTTGSVFSFGCNDYGQLGIGEIFNSKYPVQIQNLPIVSSVYCGSDFTYLITEEKSSLIAFGNNEQGQLGLPEHKYYFTPQKIETIENIAEISCGSKHSILMNNNGKLIAVGSNSNGKLGIGKTIKSTNIFTEIAKLNENPFDIISFSCGFSFSSFLDSSGDVFICGKFDNKKFEFPTKYYSDITTISTGYTHLICINNKGELLTFGDNTEGELGRNSNSHDAIVKEIENPVLLSVGGYHTFVKNINNEIWAFGRNFHTQLGLGSNKFVSYPCKLEEEYFDIVPLQLNTAKSARK